MARDFDGVDDKLDLGSDASIDAFAVKTVAFWVVKDVTNATHVIAVKRNAAGTPGWACELLNTADSNRFRLQHKWTTTGAGWLSTTGITAGQIRHIVVTYDGGSTTNAPVMYVDGVSETVILDAAATGTITSDTAETLQLGEGSTGANDFDGALQAFCYDDTIWDAAKVNRHRWWGVAPGGPSTVKVWHPFWTNVLANKGTATADATATGTTGRSLPRTERFYGSLMGCGR